MRFNPTGPFTSFHALSLDYGASPPQVQSPPTVLPGLATGCDSLLNTHIFGADGKYLGRVSNNRYQTDSIANQYGDFGSSYSDASIFNKFGIYGSSTSDLSAFNNFASRPPLLYLSTGQAVAYVTTNQSKMPRIDSSILIGCIGRTR